MTTLIIGAAGMIGRKIATTLSNEALILADALPPAPLPGATILTLDLTAPQRLLECRPATNYHLAAIGLATLKVR